MPAGPDHATARRPDLQGMRALAILTVFANHLFDWPRGGFVGVDVFFVLSGFFITGILIRERTRRGALSFKKFYIRRVKRILPSAILVLIATVVASWLLFPASRAHDTLVDALYAAVFVANFRFNAVGADYFLRSQPPSPLQHYWSLSIEEQFYFVWPALIVVIFGLTRNLRRRGKRSARQWALFGVMALIVAFSFGWAQLLSSSDANRAYFSTFTRVWELGVGALVAIAGPWLLGIPSAIRPVLGYLGLAGVGLSVFLIDSTVQFPAPWAALPVLSTACVVASFHGAPVRGMFPLTNRVAGYIGDRSYTLYLWHWPVIILLMSLVPRGPVFSAVALVLTFGLTAVTYRFYENPIRNSEWLIDRPAMERAGRRELGAAGWATAGATIAVAVVISILGLSYSDKIHAARELSTTPEPAPQESRPSGVIAADPCFGAPAMKTPGCALRNPGAPLEPSVDTFSTDDEGQFNCFRQDDRRLEPCEYGYAGTDAIRIALVGDSRAAAMLPALWGVLDANKWRMTTYIGKYCRLQHPLNTDCQWQMAEVERQLVARPYDLVIVTSANDSLSNAADYVNAWTSIAKAGNRIVAIADNPRNSEDAIACLTRVSIGTDRTGECGTPRAEAFPRPDPLVEAARLVPAATLIDLTSFYCTVDRCPSVIGNVIVYRDAGTGTHITETFATTLGPTLEGEIRRALARP